jgi:hypothetical protein
MILLKNEEVGTEGFEPPSAGTSHGTSKMVNHRPKGLIAPYLEPAILARLYYAPASIIIKTLTDLSGFCKMKYYIPHLILARLK